MKEQRDNDEPKYRPPPLCGTVVERCRAALEHVANGLECLKYFPTEEGSEEEQKKNEESSMKEERKFEEENQRMAKPFQAIPMPYAPLNQGSSEPMETVMETSPRKKGKSRKSKKPDKNFPTKSTIQDATPKALLCKSKAETLPTWQAPKKSDNLSWNAHLKTLLYEKASLIFAVLAENEYSINNYGASLRYISAVLRCQEILDTFCHVKNEKLISYLLGRAGDSCFMAVQDWNNVEKHKRDYELLDIIDKKILDEIYNAKDLDLGEFCERFATKKSSSNHFFFSFFTVNENLNPFQSVWIYCPRLWTVWKILSKLLTVVMRRRYPWSP